MLSQDGSRRPLVAVIGFIIAPLALDLPPQRPGWLLAGIVLSAIAVVLVVLEIVEGRQRFARLIPAACYLVAVGALRHSAGGAESGYSPLVLLAIVWLAFLGTRRDLVVGLAILLLVLAAPVVLAGAPDYPPEEWRRVLLMTLVSAFVGFILQQILATLAEKADGAKDQHEALARQVEVTTAILDNATDGVVSFDGEGRITAANGAAETLLGRRPDELVGRALLLDLVTPVDRVRLAPGLARWVAGKPTPETDYRFETEVLRPDGTSVPVEVTIATTHAENGVRLHAFCRDISERRGVDRANREHLDDLDRLLAVTRDLGHRGSDGRTGICESAVDLARADAAVYLEARPDGVLEATGMVGMADVSDPIELSGRSMAAIVLETSQPAFVGDLFADSRVLQGLAERLGVRAAYWQPVVMDHVVVGVLVIYWRTVREPISPRVVSLLGLFATQAAGVVERADLLARLESLARTDALTGAANRRAMEESLLRTIAAAARTRRPLSFIMLDLDRFKRYNDSRGHQGGDDLLRQVVALWRRELRQGDELARYGGEEFLVILPDCDLEAAGAIADRLRSVVPDGQTASAGVARWDGVEASDAVIARCDIALYDAKRGGRDRTVLAPARSASPVGGRAPTE
jgi:diguanylate cyclase (GGDEF)-like protein/PAS domain S-box-containing protein